ncbi:hypothetical protein [Metabacillus idriensis]|uniref:hypothetical protein n=1 Tax=Metabacillus idriensis TaxID=324768 RepID=UPI00174AEE00|nr:hypothetical protein [Metabacillus idriensis]
MGLLASKQVGVTLLNKFDLYDYEADGETLIYCMVKVTDENIDTLKELGMKDKDIEVTSNNEQHYDLTLIAWKYAEWFDGEREEFLLKKP